jgi:hypothetical protein
MGTLMVQINWRVQWQNSVWYALAVGLTRCSTRTDDRLGVHAAQQSSGLLAPLFDYHRLSLKRLNAILQRLATQATWETLPVPSENEIGAIVAEELDDLPLGRRFNYFLAPRLQRLFTAVHEATPTLADEMIVYADILRRLWEAANPELLAKIREQIPLDWQLNEVHVCPVFSVSGGGGWVHAKTNSIAMEAMPITLRSQPSEASRLCWLLAQLAVTDSTQRLSPELRPLVKYALIPAVVAATNPNDWRQFGELAIVTALQAWCPEFGDEPFEAASQLWNWRQQTDSLGDDWLGGLETLPIPRPRWQE